MRQFVFRRSDGTWSRDLSLDEVMDVAKARVKVGTGPFKLIRDNSVFKREYSRFTVLRKLRRSLVDGDVGTTWGIRNAEAVRVRVREVAPSIRVIDTNGNDKADNFWSEVVHYFSGYRPRYAGSYVCKPSSQHRFGNGVDVFFDTLVQQDRVASWAVANADRLSIQHVISRNRIWTRGYGWRSYGGEYHAHLHVDFAPNFPTWYSCGVRG